MKKTLLELLSEIRATRSQGLEAILQKQRERFVEMVAFARTHSPYYRELYQGLPEHIDDPTLLPVTEKKTLMEHFDDWVTDPEVTLKEARAFVENTDLAAEMFLGKYLLAFGSGTRGFRAVYLLDNAPGPVYSALNAYQAQEWFPDGELLQILSYKGGKASIVAMICNYPIYVNTLRKNKNNPRFAQKNRIFSVHTPIPELVAQLNEFQPRVLEGYTSTMGLLANEQEAGRLHINPLAIIVGGERLTGEERKRIARAFNTKVAEIYGSSECPNIAYGCEYGWLHIHSDWVIVEPVDEHFQPTPPGEVSHTVLVTNLCNQAQPFLRYDQGDSVIQRPDPCPCGNPLPAIQVLGRAGDELVFSDRNGQPVKINLILISTEIDRVPGLDLFQLVMTSPTSMRVRLVPAASSDPDQVWQGVSSQIGKVLAKYHLEHVSLVRAPEPPVVNPGGKYSVVLAQQSSVAAD